MVVTVRTRIERTCRNVSSRPESVEYILLEASGVADPGGIFATFSDANLRDGIRLDSVICVVNAEQVFAHPEYPPLMELKLRQVGSADMLILNKVELAGPEQGAKVRAWLDEHLSRPRKPFKGFSFDRGREQRDRNGSPPHRSYVTCNR
jgi:G3E family GTPase